MTMADYLVGIGITIAGVGLQLMFQGEALKRSVNTIGLGRGAFSIGIFWIVLGLIAIVSGSWNKWGLGVVLPEAIIILAAIVYAAFRKRRPPAPMV